MEGWAGPPRGPFIAGRCGPLLYWAVCRDLAALFILGLLVGLLSGGPGRALAAGLALPVLSLVAYLAIAAFLLILKVLVFLAALVLALIALWALIYFLRGRL